MTSLNTLSTRCRYVIFDAVGTLIQPSPSVAQAYHSVASTHGSQLSVDEIGERFRRSFRQSESIPFVDGQSNGPRFTSSDAIEFARWRWIVEQVLTDATDREQCFRELWEHFNRPSSWKCFDDVSRTLATLKTAGYQLAIASNFDSRLHSVCAGHPDLIEITNRFVSSEMGFRKPAPEFYARLVSQCGGRAEEILMIGDDPQHDVEGPLAAGMQALLLDRKRVDPGTESISSFDGLLDRLDLAYVAAQ